jgi:hypothetical protein
MGMVFGLTFVACFVQALMMAVVLHAVYPQGYDWLQGAQAGVVFWSGLCDANLPRQQTVCGTPLVCVGYRNRQSPREFRVVWRNSVVVCLIHIAYTV